MALLLVLFFRLTFNAWAQSPTMDEQNHIARGYALLRTGDPRLSIEHPPLINALEAAPLLLLAPSPALPLDDWSWQERHWYRFADLFLWQVNHDADRMVFLARLPIIALTMFLAALAYRWACLLWGEAAGVGAMLWLTNDPNILAHGSLATTDLGITFTAFLAAYALWQLARHPDGWRTLWAGLAMGAMLASKTSAPLFWGILGAWFVAEAWREGFRGVRGRVLRYGAISGIALGVLWASYAFQIAPMTDGGRSVPLGTYWQGLRAVFHNVQGGRPSYLLGRTILGGWRWYFPITFAVKTPLPTLALLGLTVPSLWRGRNRGANGWLLLPVVGYWGAALHSGLNLGYRHLLPTLPFLFVWSAQSFTEKRRWQRWGWQALGVWLLIETAWIAPHFLAYFNQVGGGPENGWRIVADSNIDWGQDLKSLRAYVAQHQLTDIKLSWFGSAPPEAYGIAYTPLPGLPHHFDLWFQPPTFDEQHPEPGVYIISVSNLVELPLEDKHFFGYFRAREPDARIGYSVYVYEVRP